MIEILKNNKMIFFEYYFLVLGFVLAATEFRDCSILVLILASLMLIKIVKNITNNYINFSTLFVCFHILYGLSGIISKAWLNQFSRTYGDEFIYCPYLIAYSLCTICLLTGILFAYKKNKENKVFIHNNKLDKYFLFVSFVGFGLTSASEIINMIRVGGIETLLSGKAIYQSLVDELIFTLPSQYIFQVSLAAYSIYLFISCKKGISIKQIIKPAILILPYLLIILVLGRRGPLLAVILILLIAFYYTKPLKKISLKIILFLAFAYLSLGLIFIIRNDIKLLFSDFDKFKEKVNINYIVKNLNPALTEFGCTYGNFNKLYISGDYEYLYGKSYIEGLVHVVPTYLYPGEKPQMITYEFRDKYFPEKAEISSIASTGFSSIMETYWNFGYFGCLIYIVFGYLIIFLENNIKKKNYFCLLEYFSIITLTYSFHRSDFGHTVSELIILTLEIVCIYIYYNLIYKKIHHSI